MTKTTMMMMTMFKDEVKCSLHNGNAEANFGDKLSSSLSGMNNLSYSNSQIRFLLNFETFHATFRVQNANICKEIISQICTGCTKKNVSQRFVSYFCSRSRILLFHICFRILEFFEEICYKIQLREPFSPVYT